MLSTPSIESRTVYPFPFLRFLSTKDFINDGTNLMQCLAWVDNAKGNQGPKVKYGPIVPPGFQQYIPYTCPFQSGLFKVGREQGSLYYLQG